MPKPHLNITILLFSKNFSFSPILLFIFLKYVFIGGG